MNAGPAGPRLRLDGLSSPGQGRGLQLAWATEPDTLSTGKARKRVRERKVKTKASVQKLANHYQYRRINMYR